MPARFLPVSAPTARACSRRSPGISAWRSGSRISPVCSSSIRESSVRAMRKDEGTTPLAIECMPVEGQVVGGALLAALDEHHAARVRHALLLERLDGGAGSKRGIAVIGG